MEISPSGDGPEQIWPQVWLGSPLYTGQETGNGGPKERGPPLET